MTPPASRPLCLDLFCGTGSATDTIREHGCMEVVGFDILTTPKSRRPDVRADVRQLPVKADPYFVWASPPCTEFSELTRTATARGFRGPPDPEAGMELVRAAWSICRRAKHYAIENVRGSVPHISPLAGRPRLSWAGRYIWSDFDFPWPMPNSAHLHKKASRCETTNREWANRLGLRNSWEGYSAVRSMIPRPLAEAVHMAVCPAPPSVPRTEGGT